jgi:hypothetical protein
MLPQTTHVKLWGQSLFFDPRRCVREMQSVPVNHHERLIRVHAYDPDRGIDQWEPVASPCSARRLESP